MLINIAVSVPPYKVNQEKASSELKKRMNASPVVSRLIETASNYSGISKRHIVIPDGEESINEKFYSKNGNYFKPDTEARMNLYEEWSKVLAKEAVCKLSDELSFSFREIDKIITISCTGFFAPGLDYYLMNEFKISPSAKRTNIGFMGCAASIVGFNNLFDTYNSTDKIQNTLLVSVELCSLHLHTEPTRDNILANMIFADGCAAALFSNSEKFFNKNRLKIISVDSFLFPDSAEYMGWKIGTYGFEMNLSSELPKIIFESASPQLLKTISSKNINKNEIKHWALHPGGRAILDSLQNGLKLSDEQMIPSRNILKNYGNMSSASILFVLKEILDNAELKKDDYLCAAAFGPGLTMESVIMQVV